MTAQPPTSSLQVGKIKTFGVDGPKYEVMGSDQASTDGEWLVPIHLIESGEQLDYRYSRFALDPEAR